MRKKYNTPHRSRVVKTRLSEDEYADFTARLAPYGISQSEFLRQAIRRTAIRPVIHVSAVNDELLSAVGKLAAEYGRIGGNLNQIARYLNEYGAPYICPVCFWENDPFIASDNEPSDSNHGITLKEAKFNFSKFGACEKEMLCHVRPPRDDEKKTL